MATPTMSYVVPMLLTAPLNLLFIVALGWIPTDAPFCLGIVIAGCVNAVVLSMVVRAVRGRWPRLPSTPSAHGA